MKNISPCSEAYPQSVDLITPSSSLIDVSWVIRKINPNNEVKCSIKIRKESETIFTLFPLNYKIDKNDKKDGKFNCGLMKSKELHIIKKNLKSFDLD